MNLVNGVAGEMLSVRDRGLAYGDGVFRTFPIRGGKPMLWQRQYAKLQHDCGALEIPCPSRDALERDLALLDASDCVAKVIVTRGGGARGYAPPLEPAPTRVVVSGPLPEYRALFVNQGIRARVCRLRLSSQPRLAGIKHLNRLENVLARAEWHDAAIAEGLLCDCDDKVIGGTMSNVFIVEAGKLVTPALTRCGVEGVMRDLVLELARINDVETEISTVTVSRVLAADALFVVNSVIGLWPVASLEQKVWQKGALIAQLQQWIEDARGA
jgi:4-amino-4-deoxychorismate lyase